MSSNSSSRMAQDSSVPDSAQHVRLPASNSTTSGTTTTRSIGDATVQIRCASWADVRQIIRFERMIAAGGNELSEK